MASYDWNEIFARYETGDYSMKELAEEYGFNMKYALRKAKEQGVEKGRLKDRIQEEVSRQIVEEKAEQEKKLREEYGKIINNIRRGAYTALFQEKDFDRLKQFKIASQIMRNCRKEQWEINEIKEVATDINQMVQIVDDIE